MIEIAIATGTGLSEWWDASDAVLATALEVLEIQAAEIKKARRR